MSNQWDWRKPSDTPSKHGQPALLAFHIDSTLDDAFELAYWDAGSGAWWIHTTGRLLKATTTRLLGWVPLQSPPWTMYTMPAGDE